MDQLKKQNKNIYQLLPAVRDLSMHPTNYIYILIVFTSKNLLKKLFTQAVFYCSFHNNWSYINILIDINLFRLNLAEDHHLS